MAFPNARNQYLKTQIETASKEQLVVMLFDGVVRFTEYARKAMEGGQIEDSHHSLMRAQAIIMELICTIDRDKGGEVANNLMSLHAYAFNCLIVCNMKKDVSKINEVQKIYRELRGAWVGAMDTLGFSSNAGKHATHPGTTPAASPSISASVPKATLAATLQPPIPAIDPSLAPDLSKTVNTANAGDGIAAADPAMPKAACYGMGKAALMGSLLNKPVVQPAQAASGAAKQEALLGSYGNGARSIA